MIEFKFLEIRDSGTFIPAMAVALTGDDHPLLRRAGFGPDRYVLLTHLNDMEQQYDAFMWNVRGRGRTMHVAHLYVEKRWDRLRSGDVVDVQYELGETSRPKASEL